MEKRTTKVLPSAVRSHNTNAVLGLLYPDHELTRADLARATGLTRVVVSDIVADLIDIGLVEERGLSKTDGPGKRGRLLAISVRSRSIVVMDFSQPFVLRGAVMDLAGHVTAREEVAVRDADETGLDLVRLLCARLSKRTYARVLGVGVACPGIISSAGVVVEATLLGWHNVDLHAVIQDCMGCPVFVENDANAETIAEWRFGERSPDMLLVQLSAGIGAGLMMSGRLMRGANMQAGEIGHIVVRPDGEQCRCGKRGCLETVVNASDLARDIERSPQRRRRILQDAGTYLGQALAVAIGLVDVSKVMVLGDSRVVNAMLLDAVQRRIDSDVSSRFRGNVVVHRSALGDDAALLGACSLVLTDWLGDSADATFPQAIGG